MEAVVVIDAVRVGRSTLEQIARVLGRRNIFGAPIPRRTISEERHGDGPLQMRHPPVRIPNDCETFVPYCHRAGTVRL
jgi:hypothetical protein